MPINSSLVNKRLISICIPAYKRTDYLVRLLDSIAVQTYQDFEVVVTDDSPDNSVEEIVQKYPALNIRCFKNNPALGTPANWNYGISLAKGDWIKLMHDDDWFSSPDSLQQFADAIVRHPEVSFFFSAYANVYEDTGYVKPMFLSAFWEKALKKNTSVLIADNVVGPPSVTLHRNDKRVWYDTSMKYVVDIDFYIRYLEQAKFFYINEPLINVGINSAQVTKYTFNVPEVHLKESLYLLQKTGAKPLKNLLVFDGWWRLIRNFQIGSEEDIRATGYDGTLPPKLIRIINFQKKIPFRLLKKGVLSKLLMVYCYALYSRKII